MNFLHLSDSTARTPRRLGACLALAALLCAGVAHAQLNYTDTSGPRTYAAITVPPAQVVILGTNEVSAVISPSGFSFSFAGTTYTEFVIGRCGFISLGAVSAAPGAALYAEAVSHALVSPYGVGDLFYTGNTEIGWDFQAGVLTVQWQSIADVDLITGTTNPPELSFQASLDTASGAIEFSYAVQATGTFKPRTYGDIVALYGPAGANGRVSRVAAVPGFITDEGAVQAWPGDTFVRFSPTGSSRQAPTVQVSAQGTALLNQNTAVVSAGESIASVNLVIQLNDADGDYVFVRADVAGSALNVVETEFESVAAAVPYQLRPTSGSMPDFSFMSVYLRIHDGSDGIRTFVFFVRTPNSAPPTPPPGQFRLNPIAEIILMIAFAGLKSGSCTANDGEAPLAVAVLLALMAVAALKRRRSALEHHE